MLMAEALPELLMAPCLDVLRTLSPSERDLIRLVVESVQELRDAVYGEDEDEPPTVCFLLPLVYCLTDGTPEVMDPKASFQAEEPRRKAPTRKSIEGMAPEQRVLVDQTDLRCLAMCIGMLERVNSVRPYPLSLNMQFNHQIYPTELGGKYHARWGSPRVDYSLSTEEGAYI
jgi:condensin complex subunit 3